MVKNTVQLQMIVKEGPKELLTVNGTVELSTPLTSAHIAGFFYNLEHAFNNAGKQRLHIHLTDPDGQTADPLETHNRS